MDRRVCWAGAAAAVVMVGCVVSTQGVPGEAGAPGDSVWKEGEGSAIYYSDGNVGIRNPTPRTPLDVAGAISFTSLDNLLVGGSIEYGRDGSRVVTFVNQSDDPNGGWDFASSGSMVARSLVRMRNDGSLSIGNATKDDVINYSLNINRHGTPVDPGPFSTMPAFQIADYADEGPGMFDDREGLVNINYYKIDDNDTGSSNAIILNVGNANSSALMVSAARAVGIRTTKADGYNNGPEYPLDVNGDARVKGNLTITGDLNVMGKCCMSSDARLKKNIAPLPDALSRLLRLRGVTYEWIDPAKHGYLTGPQTGMIAQEVEKVFPEWVGTDRDGYKTLSIRGFEALAVESFRALRTENDDLRRQVADLSSRADRTVKLEAQFATERAAREKLEARLAALEALVARSTSTHR
jgi:hypothetical protein